MCFFEYLSRLRFHHLNSLRICCRVKLTYSRSIWSPHTHINNLCWLLLTRPFIRISKIGNLTKKLFIKQSVSCFPLGIYQSYGSILWLLQNSIGKISLQFWKNTEKGSRIYKFHYFWILYHIIKEMEQLMSELTYNIF